MATKKEFMEYVADQFSGAGEVTYKKMFGEYGFYLDGKIVGLVCDDTVYLKPTEAGRALLGQPVLAPPYEGRTSTTSAWTTLRTGRPWPPSSGPGGRSCPCQSQKRKKRRPPPEKREKYNETVHSLRSMQGLRTPHGG